MNVTEWLMRARNAEREVEILERSRKREFERVTKITAQMSGTAGASGTRDPHKFDRLAEFDEILIRRERDLLTAKTEIADMIGRINDNRYRMMLQLRYVDCRSWNEIEEEMHYSKSGCFKIHGKAIAYLEGMMN